MGSETFLICEKSSLSKMIMRWVSAGDDLFGVCDLISHDSHDSHPLLEPCGWRADGGLRPRGDEATRRRGDERENEFRRVMMSEDQRRSQVAPRSTDEHRTDDCHG